MRTDEQNIHIEPGKMTTQALQLAIEYDPTPPFDSGSPAKAPDTLAARVASRVRAKFVYADVHLTRISRQIP